MCPHFYTDTALACVSVKHSCMLESVCVLLVCVSDMPCVCLCVCASTRGGNRFEGLISVLS